MFILPLYRGLGKGHDLFIHIIQSFQRHFSNHIIAKVPMIHEVTLKTRSNLPVPNHTHTHIQHEPCANSIAYCSCIYSYPTLMHTSVFHVKGHYRFIWVRSRNCGCLVTWFCYQLIAKPGNKTATVLWPDPYYFEPNIPTYGHLIDNDTPYYIIHP